MLGKFQFNFETLKAMVEYYPDYEGYNEEIKHIAEYLVYQLEEVEEYNKGEVEKVCEALNKRVIKRINGVNLNDAVQDTLMLAFLMGMMHAENIRLDYFAEDDYIISDVKKMERIMEGYDDEGSD